MKTVNLAIAFGALILGCGDGTANPETQAKPAAKPTGGGMFDGKVGDRSYHLGVTCSYLDQDYFMFKSDRTDAVDSNGDGLVVSGMQNGDKFVLTVIDNGVTFSTGRLDSFSKSGTGAEGSGTLYQDGSPDSFAAQFTVNCQ